MDIITAMMKKDRQYIYSRPNLVLCFRPEVALELPMVVADENSNLLESSEPKENKGKTLSPFCATVFSANGVAIVGVEGG